MDNLTHSLTGLALARTGLNRFCPHATLLLILSANAPDSDVVAWVRGSLSYLEVHRGYSHSIAGLPIMAALTVAVAGLFYRKSVSWLRAWIICCIGVASHLLLDWTNSYGIRLLLPFSSRWFHLDLNSLWDGVILSVLILAALWPSFVHLVGNEMGDRRPASPVSAFGALAFCLIFDGARGILHARAIAELQSSLYDGMLPIETAALPDRFNPLLWTGVAETSDSYRLLPINMQKGNLELDRARVFFKPAMEEGLERAKATEAFRYFLYFARFPVWSQRSTATEAGSGERIGSRIDLTDLRFGTPGQGSFHCIALEGDRSEVQHSWFTFGSGADPGGNPGD